MKVAHKKSEVVAPAVHPTPPVKQTSGDKQFDDAIDRMLKPRPQQAPAK